MPVPGKCDVRELEVYRMLERLGIELGAGVIPRYGLIYASPVPAPPGSKPHRAPASPLISVRMPIFSWN